MPSWTVFRWLDELNFSPPTTSILRWPARLVSSYLTPPLRWSHGLSAPRWSPHNLINSSIVDDVVWSLVTAVESVALVSMLCFFYVFCGCTV